MFEKILILQKKLPGGETCARSESGHEQAAQDGEAALRGDQQAGPPAAPLHRHGREQALPRPALHLRLQVQHPLLHLGGLCYKRRMNALLNWCLNLTA